MIKVAIVCKTGASTWLSCQVISANLIQAYSKIDDIDLTFVEDRSSSGAYGGILTAEELVSGNFEKIVFIEHTPHPIEILKGLYHLSKTYKPELYFHVYGDFTLNLDKWVIVESILKNYNTCFICASDKHSGLITKFINSQNSLVKTIPFPVNESLFYYSEELRHQYRQSMSWSEDEFVILYSGRLSLQKNILYLIEAFDFFRRSIRGKVKLCLVGWVDDLGLPYIGKSRLSGMMDYEIQFLIKKLFYPDAVSMIQYLGNVPNESLNKIYNAADLFVSPSTHNDEDFGMSVGEALLTGASAVLTDWGGYSQFASISKDLVSLIPVIKSKDKNSPDFQKLIIQLIDKFKSYNPKGREEAALSAQNSLSTKKISNLLYELLLNPNENNQFNGFTDIMHATKQSFVVNPNSPFGFGKKYNDLYRELYGDY
ncbi:MAG: glycosyltransferase [Bdellovibrionales bacterium]|nr:glycosyltransferase [Bdellovibrionales bacterium]